LAHQLPDVTTLFSASADDPMLAILNERQQAKRAFFDFFTHSETQNVRALFDQAKTLRTSKAGARTLEPLIAPYLERGRAAIRQAQREGSLSPSWRLARDELTLALLLYPTHEPTHLLLGSLHETQRDWAAAAERYEAVLRQNDGQLAALFGLARIRKATGDRDAETALLRRARARHPGEWATHQNLAVTLIQLGELEEAKELLEQAARLAPSTTAEPHSGLAELHFAEENAPAALVEAERAVLIAPTAYHLFLRGRARLEIGDSERALRDFEKAVLTDTNFVLARATIGQIQAQRGQLDQAAVSFRAVLAQDPGNQAARENLEKIRAIETRRTPRAEENGAKPDESVVPEGSAQ
jgi:tetratricopeptide (TPR) repeat protein